MPATAPSFKVTRHEHDLIVEIVKRAEVAFVVHGVPFDRMTMHMDITACHANGNALRLEDLRDAPDFDFLHDVLGIRRHIDRRTGKLGDCFVPRYRETIRE